MKKIVILLLSAILTLSLTSCGEGGEADSAEWEDANFEAINLKVHKAWTNHLDDYSLNYIFADDNSNLQIRSYNGEFTEEEFNEIIEDAKELAQKNFPNSEVISEGDWNNKTLSGYSIYETNGVDDDSMFINNSYVTYIYLNSRVYEITFHIKDAFVQEFEKWHIYFLDHLSENKDYVQLEEEEEWRDDDSMEGWSEGSFKSIKFQVKDSWIEKEITETNHVYQLDNGEILIIGELSYDPELGSDYYYHIMSKNLILKRENGEIVYDEKWSHNGIEGWFVAGTAWEENEIMIVKAVEFLYDGELYLVMSTQRGSQLSSDELTDFYDFLDAITIQ